MNNSLPLTEEIDAQVNHRTVTGRKRRAATETKIIHAAVKIFSELGPHAPVIDDFVKAAGVSRGTFYNYFKTTEELLSTTIECRLNEINEFIESQVAGTEDPLVRFAFVLRTYLARAQKEPVWGAFMAQIPVIGTEAERRMLSDLRHGLRLGKFKFSNMHAAIDLVVGTMRQSFRRISVQAVPDDYPREVIHTILRSLGVEEAEIVQLLENVPADQFLQNIPAVPTAF